MLGDLRIDQFAPMRLQAGKRALLVDTHQTAIAGDIGRQNGRQPSLHPLAGQACRSRNRRDAVAHSAPSSLRRKDPDK